MAAMSASGSDGPSPAPKLSSAPGPPSRSARARNRDRAAPIFPSSVPTIRYAGLIAPKLFVFELLLALTQASVFVVPAASVAWAIASTGRLDAPSAAARAAVAVPAAAVLLRRRGRRARGRARRRRGAGCGGRLGRRGGRRSRCRCLGLGHGCCAVTTGGESGPCPDAKGDCRRDARYPVHRAPLVASRSAAD